MKAFVFTQYGAPEQVLQLREIEKPVPGENEVLVKVHATTINDYDLSIVTGDPFIYRLMFGLGKPRKKLQIPGMELSGTVEAVGANVEKFKAGDAVYGDTSDHGFGTFAEYTCLNEKALARKPANMDFEEAAATPHAAMLALQGLRDVGKIKEGQKVLINGGGGGVGTFGLQFAKEYSAEITGVDTGEKLQMMQNLGYDRVIDFKKTDFTREGKQYNLILDCKTNRSPFDYLRALSPGGKYVTVGGTPNRLLQLLAMKPIIALKGSKSVHLVALKANKDLDYINRQYESGRIKCIIDSPYDFEKIPWAIRYFGEGKHSGKVVIKVK